MKYYKILFISLISFSIYGGAFGFDFETNCQKQTFVVTAYYSPLANQSFYYKDSFEAEKTLNGKGTHGASGKGVFNGMLAAPSTYAFGGKIYFPSLGIGEIADRGGAIVHAGERSYNHDRIDIWMGKGEEGLVKALTFGKRTITGYYCNAAKIKSLKADSKIKVGFDFSVIPVLKYFFDATLFIPELEINRRDMRAYKLQEYLVKFGYMHKKTGYFGPETKAALCRYQLKRGITSQKYCGVFGKRTRSYMKSEAKRRGFLPDFGLTTDISNLLTQAQNYTNPYSSFGNNTTKTEIKTDSQINNKPLVKTIENIFTQAYKKNTKSPKISKLQDMLRHYGFYRKKPTGIYDQSTINSIHKFQIAAGILKADDYSNPAKGWMGPSTRKKLNEKWSEFEEFKLR